MGVWLWRRCRGWWNWKTSLASALLRAPLFFFTNLEAGWAAAYAAFVTEFLYRVIAAGFYGALTEAFARIPSRLRSASALVVLPGIGHGVEFLVHAWAGTPALGRSIAASVVVSVFTTLFSLSVMRKGLFLAQSDRSFWTDVKQLAAFRFVRS
jgi:hypothetical protein